MKALAVCMIHLCVLVQSACTYINVWIIDVGLKTISPSIRDAKKRKKGNVCVPCV